MVRPFYAVLLIGIGLAGTLVSCSFLSSLFPPGSASDVVTVTVSSKTVSSGDTYTFPDTIIGKTSAASTFTVTNISKQPISLPADSAVSITGSNASQFALSAAPGTTTLDSGKSTTFALTFSPSAHASAIANAALNTTFNNKTYTVGLTLDGKGVISQIAVYDLGTDSSPTNTQLTSGSSTVNFGTTAAFGSSYPQSVTHHFKITNGGDGALTLTQNPTISNDTSSGDYSVSSNPTNPVAPGSSTNFDLTFAAQGLSATETAKVEIDSDSTADTAFTFDLSGTDNYS